MSELLEYLQSLSPGPVADRTRLIEILSADWDAFAGSNDEAMATHKLSRIERLEWRPPYVTFEIERHGATVMGSITAEVQRWQVDAEARRAEIVEHRSRRIGKAAPRLDVRPIAREIADLILTGQDDPRITWRADRRAARVNVRASLPPAANQTQQARVKRLHAVLKAELDASGYTRDGAWYRSR